MNDFSSSLGCWGFQEEVKVPARRVGGLQDPLGVGEGPPLGLLESPLT